MSVLASQIAMKLVGKQISKSSPALRPDYVSMKSLDAVFTDPKKSEIVNTYLGGLDSKERDLLDKKKQLLKETPEAIPWRYYRRYLLGNPHIEKLEEIYTNIFNQAPGYVPEIVPFNEEAYEAELEDRSRTLPDYTSLVGEKASEMINSIERDLNPLLNPFADFWIYEKDGPEFAEVFEARPKWNEIINRRADEFAFEFNATDPATDPEMVAAYRAKVVADMDKFKVEGNPDEILRRIMSGEIDKAITDHYNHSLEHNEQHALEHITEDDITALAFRNGFISPEADPVAKRFGAH